MALRTGGQGHLEEPWGLRGQGSHGCRHLLQVTHPVSSPSWQARGHRLLSALDTGLGTVVSRGRPGDRIATGSRWLHARASWRVPGRRR